MIHKLNSKNFIVTWFQHKVQRPLDAPAQRELDHCNFRDTAAVVGCRKIVLNGHHTKWLLSDLGFRVKQIPAQRQVKLVTFLFVSDP